MVTKIIDMQTSKISRASHSASFVKGRIRSFGYAWAGIRKFFASEKNAQVHLAAAVVAISLSVLLQISRVEAIIILFSIAFVWITEMINTAIERAMDFISVEQSPYIKTIKDLAAGAVLIATVTAVLAGAIIFIPKIISL
jgi:diacylglycerol kinase (ATP)